MAGMFKLGTDSDQFLGQGSAFEETESGAGVKFDVHSTQSPGSVRS